MRIYYYVEIEVWQLLELYAGGGYSSTFAVIEMMKQILRRIALNRLLCYVIRKCA